VDLDALRAATGPQTAGLMLTNPSTLGVFEKQILDIKEDHPECGRPAVLRRREPERDLGKVKPATWAST